MGLGKTAQAITASKGAKSILVLCPAIGVFNWKDEFEKWLDPLLPPPKIHIVSYNKFSLNPVPPFTPDLLICDEAHFLKNPSSKRTKSVFGKDGIANKAKAVWCLTGTPMPNYPNDLWVFMRKAGVTTLDYRTFCLRYCATIPSGFGMGFRIIGMNTTNKDELKDKLSDILLRRTKEEVLTELPKLHWATVLVEPCAVDIDIIPDFRTYRNPEPMMDLIRSELIEQTALVEKVISVCGKDRTGLISKTLLSVAPAMQTMRRINGLKKIKGVVELVTDELEANAYKKIVIFAIHTSVILGIMEGLKKFRPVQVTGKMTENTRRKSVEAFNNNENVKVFVGQLHACGTTINLTSSKHVLIVEADWTPANNAQAIARCHRIGQSNTVLARYIAIANSIDSQITRVMARKTQAEMSLFSKTLLTDEEELDNGRDRDSNAHRILNKLNEIKEEAKKLRAKQQKGKHFDEDKYFDPRNLVSGPFSLGDPDPKPSYVRHLLETSTGEFARDIVESLNLPNRPHKHQKPE